MVTDLMAGLEKALGALLALLLGIVTHLWKRTEKRIDVMGLEMASKSAFDAHVAAHRHDLELLEVKINAKADEDEMVRQRANINELFAQDTKLRQEMHSNQIAVMNTLTTIATQVAHISGKLDK